MIRDAHGRALYEGDPVRHRSGGPVMGICRFLVETDVADAAVCVWPSWWLKVPGTDIDLNYAAAFPCRDLELQRK
jgi:hypothetical protein